MSIRINEGLGALTEKEKQTLRLIVRGHDAKSIARSLDLSVHTINERLRDARRKLAVSSSRAAARLLLEAEHGASYSPAPDSLEDAQIGDDAVQFPMDRHDAPIGGAGRAHRRHWIVIGVPVMIIALGLLVLAAMPQLAPTPSSAPSYTAGDAEVVDAARSWLALVDQGRWEDSYQATGAAFRKQNTAQVWAAASEKARTPLGAMISRILVAEESLPAPPAGYDVVKFRTRFANRPEALETVTLENENGGWHVVGVTIR